MKCDCVRRALIVLTVFVLSQTGYAQQAGTPDGVAEPQEAQTATGGPRITFDKTAHDFGKVSSQSDCTAQFAFKNTGSDVLNISDVRKCCGAVVTLDKKELAPGESGTLKVQYNTGASAGLMSRQLRVLSNDQTKPLVVLNIRAQVVLKVDYQPQRFELVPNKENAGCPKITITSFDKKPFSIKSFQSTGQIITADVNPSAKATKFVLDPKVDLEKLKKQSAGAITISLTHPEQDKVTIPFRMMPQFRIMPGSIVLVNPTPLQPEVEYITITNNYDEQFEIETASSEKGLAKALGKRAIPNGYRLRVEVTPPVRDAATNAFADILTVQVKGGEKLSIRCYGRYLDAAKK